MGEDEIYEVLGMTPPEAGGARLQGSGGAAQAPVSGEDADRAVVGQSPMTRAGGEDDAGAASEQDPENVSDLDTTGDDAAEESPTGTEDNGQDGSTENLEEQPAGAADKSRPDGQDARWQEMTRQMIAQAIAEERAKNQKEWGDFFAVAGLRNSLDNGKPITNLEEFRQWKAAYDRAKLEQDLKEGKLSPEALESLIAQKVADNTSPAAGGVTEQAAPKQARSQEVTQEQIHAELAEIHRLDGSVNGLEDILKLETGGAFQEAVRRGHSFLDAFKLANFDRLQSQRQNEAAQRAAQAARNSARSKEHLRPSTSKGGNGSVAVPGDVMEMYRMMMPNASEDDITAHYNRMLKEMKK